MSQSSLILELPYIQPAQAQKHVTHNEALRVLDAIVQLSVTSASLTTPPAAPEEGDRYLVPTGASGDWVDHEGNVAIWDTGVWAYLTAQAGWQAFVRDTSVSVFFDGTVWADVTVALETLQNMQLLGVNTTADATNRLAVASPATLLNHEGSDHRLKINKSGAADTASLLFQAGFTGHAEMGLAGSNGFGVRVSDDGNTWTTAFAADPATGTMDLPQGATVGAGLSGAGIIGTAAAGALFERGSTSAGSWVRFVDGTQICAAKVTLTYERASRLEYEWFFPVPFANGTEVSSSMSVRNELQATPEPEDMGFVGCRAGSGDRNLSVRARVYRITGTADFGLTDEIVAYVTASGRWF